MLSIRKFFKSKLRSSSSSIKEGHNGKYIMTGTRVRTIINEEYREVFRTKSYTEICDKIQDQLEPGTSLDDVNSFSSSSSSPSSSPSPPPPSPPSRNHHIPLSEYLVEPCQETLVSISESSNYHHLITNYFDISLEASQICDFILQHIHQVRLDYNKIKNVIEFVERKPDYKNWSHSQHNIIYKKLTSFSMHSNPFSSMTPQKLQELHNTHKHLLHELKSNCPKPKKKKRLFIKRALEIVGCGALGIALLLLAMHSMVGMVAAPGLIAISSLVISLVKKVKREKEEAKRKQQQGVDVAAKGIYVLIKDFDVMSRLVQKLRDEMEHRKVAVEVCVKKGKNGVLKKVAREFQRHEYGFLGELEELEKQIYLCFLDINRSRRLLIQQLGN